MDKSIENVPTHVAFVMDGNGRWATLRGLPRIKGHYEGVKRVDDVIDYCCNRGVSVVSLFVFSTENWARPKAEIDGLFNIARKYVKKINDFVERGIKVVVSGEEADLPSDLLESIAKVTIATKHCDNITLNLCINYGGQQDVVNAVNKCVDIGKKITLDEFSRQLYNGNLPPPDLIVRTGGQMRLSNFLLFQAAYAEFVFVDNLWPDVDNNLLDSIFTIFSNRTRKFGAVEE